MFDKFGLVKSIKGTLIRRGFLFTRFFTERASKTCPKLISRTNKINALRARLSKILRSQAFDFV